MSVAAEQGRTTAWRPGGTVAGYRLVDRLAAGMTTEIWLAKIMGAEGFEKVIVLKAMRASLAPSPTAARTFTSEAAVTARLYHRNIVQLIDCGHGDDRYYMVMEFIDGMTLRQMIGRLGQLGRPIPWTLLAHIGIEICAALQYLHELQATHGPQGYLHRALEPENLMVTGAGAVKIIDFGAARPAPGGGEGRPFGRKLRYASPEVAQGTAEDRRGDVYSLGAVLYELITGVPAFDGDSLGIVSRIVEGKPRPARTLAPALPDRLATIVDKAMARRREDRYATADALSLDLQDFIAHAPSPSERGQSMKAALRSLFDGPSVAPWREALAISRRPRVPSAGSVISSTPAPSGAEWPALPPSIEAAWCFDRGLAFISDRKHAEALAEWQRAVELDPLNRLYQTNLNRLRGQIESKSPGPFPTVETPAPVVADAAADRALMNLLGWC